MPLILARATERRRALTMIPNEPFRARFLQLRAEGTTACEIAARMGWMRARSPGSRAPGYVAGDAGRLRTTLGLKTTPATTTRGYRYPPRTRAYVHYKTALLLADAMHMTPQDWDF